MKKIILSLLFSLLLASAAQAKALDRKTAIRNMETQIASLWATDDFSGLENLSIELREKKTRIPSGIWSLSLFYSFLSQEAYATQLGKSTINQYREKIEKWLKLYPNSPSAHLLYARSLATEGWIYRGGEYANAVTEDGRRVFKEKINATIAYLVKHQKSTAQDPYVYELMIQAANWSGYSESAVEAIIQKAVAAEPEYWPIYFAATDYFSPKWHGSAEKIESFARKSADKVGGPDVDALYTRIYWWAADNYFERQFFKSKADCARVLRGIDVIMQKYPDQWNINNFARFAVSCGAGQKAEYLFSIIGDDFDLEAWESANNFIRFKIAAKEMANLEIKRPLNNKKSQ